MTAREEGLLGDAPSLQGIRFAALTGEQREAVLREAFDYRGDVTLTLDDGLTITGYLFEVDAAAAEPHVRLFPAETGSQKLRVPIERIVACDFSGRDTADGRSWEAWVKRWEEKRRLAALGVDVGDIEPRPDDLG